MLEQIQQSDEPSSLFFLFQVIDNYVGGRGLISEQEINGSTVSNIFVAAASLQDTGITLHHLCNWWDVLAEAKRTNSFDSETLKEVEDFLKTPKAWRDAKQS